MSDLNERHEAAYRFDRHGIEGPGRFASVDSGRATVRSTRLTQDVRRDYAGGVTVVETFPAGTSRDAIAAEWERAFPSAGYGTAVTFSNLPDGTLVASCFHYTSTGD